MKPVYEKLSSIAARLENQPFFQTHKSFLVHLAFISRVDPDLRCFVMADGRNIPIRRELMGKAKRAWKAFLSAATRSTACPHPGNDPAPRTQTRRPPSRTHVFRTGTGVSFSLFKRADTPTSERRCRRPRTGRLPRTSGPRSG